jgi:hypothetical protein
MSTQVKEEIIISPFTIEADHPRSSDLLLQAIPNCRLRSAIKASRTTIRNPQSPTNEPVIPKDQARHLGSLPVIPGMRLSVDPANLTYEITDPLCDNPELCDRIESALNSDDRPLSIDKIKGVPVQKGELDVHRMKTLCREIVWLLKDKHVKMAKGPQPDMDDVEELPGKYLLNPGSRVPNNQPVYEEDMPQYVDNLKKSGG